MNDESAGERETLTAPSGEFVGILIERSAGEADGGEQLGDARSELCAADRSLSAGRLSNDLPDAESGVQRPDRVLEDDLDLSADGTKTASLEVRDVLAVETNGAPSDVVKSGDRPTQGRLARARFADQAERLLGPEIERNPVDGVDDLLRESFDRVEERLCHGEMLVDVPDLQDRVGHARDATSSLK